MKCSFIFNLFLVIAVLGYGQSGKSPVKEVYISTVPRPTAPAFLVISAISFSDGQGNGNQLLDANETAELKFTITNTGKGNAYNLIIKATDKNQVKGIGYTREKPLGNLQAGKQITVSVPVSGAMELESGKAEFEILVEEGNNFDADPFHISFNTQKFKNPLLTVADYKFTTNEEGKIKLGQPVDLTIVIQNEGQGDATDIAVSFVNPADVFPAGETNFTISRLKPNESQTISYEFFANKKYPGSDIPIQVIISESYKKYGRTKTLTVSLDQALSQTQQVEVSGQYDQQVQINKVSLTSDVDKNIPENGNEDEDKFALIIGNEDYTSYQQGLSAEMNVAFAGNDAAVFKDYCRKTFGVPEKNITYLANATVGKLVQAIDKLNKLIQATAGKAKVIVYYAGHGLPDEVSKEPYLIPVDVSGSDVQSAVKLSFLYGKLTEFPAQQVTVFLDACFSGGARGSGLVASRGVKVKPKYDYLKGNIVVFAASSGEESSLPWSEKQHGMFTYFLLKKFQETKGDIDFADLSTYLKEKVGIESVRTNNKSQNPQVLYDERATTSWEKRKL